MVDSLLITQTIYILATLTSIGVSVTLWQHRERTGALALLLMMGAMAIWNGSVALFITTDSVTIASLSLRTTSVGITLVSLMKLVFVLEYTGREHLLRPRIVGALAIPAVVVVILTFANPAGLIYTTLEPSTAGPLAITYEFGPAVLAYIAYAYALNVVATAMILGFLYRSHAVYRGQSLVLLGGAMAPWIAHVVYTMDVLAIDPTPVGGIVSGALFTVAVVRYRLLDLMPIARERVLDTVTDGIFVTDGNDRLVDVNSEGRRMLAALGVDTDPLLGQRFSSLFDEKGFRDRYEAVTTGSEETTLQVAIGNGRFEMVITPIDDGRDRHVGWLVIARDVTERKRREERLERQNTRLERFASLVSHDLRNPLNVADGYLELAFETSDDEAYLDEVEESHERMETIIEDVLALAREGTDVTDPEPVALEALAERAWNGVDTGSASVTIDAATPILADADRLRRLLENLFRNSIEHGTESPDTAGLEITVGTIGESTDDSFEGFYVEDDGIGIPACRRDQVLEDGYTTGAGGTGLGLSIVESIATAHDWSIRIAESEAGGVRFEFVGIDAADSQVSTPPAAES